VYSRKQYDDLIRPEVAYVKVQAIANVAIEAKVEGAVELEASALAGQLPHTAVRRSFEQNMGKAVQKCRVPIMMYQDCLMGVTNEFGVPTCLRFSRDQSEAAYRDSKKDFLPKTEQLSSWHLHNYPSAFPRDSYGCEHLQRVPGFNTLDYEETVISDVPLAEAASRPALCKAVLQRAVTCVREALSE